MSEQQLNSFEKWLIRSNYNHKTINIYVKNTKKFLEYTEKSGLNVENMWKNDFGNYIKFLENKKLSARTIQQKIESIRSYMKFLFYEYEIKTKLTRITGSGVPLIDLPKIQIVQKFNHTKEMTMFEYNRIVELATDYEDFQFALLLKVLLTTGLRIAEALSIKTEQIIKPEFEIKGKRGKYRTIYPVAKIKKEARAVIRKRKIESPWLFVGRSGRQLSKSSAQKKIIKYGKLARVKREKLFLHNIRHLFAINQLKMGRQLNELAREMGIKDFKVLEIYQARANKKEFNEKIAKKIKY